MTDRRVVFVKLETAFSPQSAQEAGKVIKDTLQNLWKCDVDVIVHREDVKFESLKDVLHQISSLEPKPNE